MSSFERKFQGVWIPADTWLDRGLSITEKVMLVEIASLETPERGCYASNAHFAGFFDLSVSRVSEIISSLASKGMVEVEQIRDGKRIVERRIRVVHVDVERRATPGQGFDKSNTPSEKAANPFGKGDEPPSENTKGSNTSINNTKNKDLLADVANAFELYWKTSNKNGSKKKAASIFASICKRDNRDPMEFAAMLVADTNARKKANQFGFDKLHGTTYLTQERWNDTITAGSDSGKPSMISQNFSQKTYEGSSNDQFAEYFQ